MPSDTGGTGATGGTGGTSSVNPAAPVVTITSPDAEDNPNGPGVIVDRQLDVLCTAEPAAMKGATVEPSSVLIEMLDRKGGVVASSAGTATGRDDEYTAHFSMGDVPDNGVVTFRCTATDKSQPPLVGQTELAAFVDHGPIVEFSEPSDDNDPIALNKPLKITFTVRASQVGKGDRGADVGTVAMTVKGKGIPLTEVDGEYTATVNLNDPELFPNPPDDSTPIVVTASNVRKPKAAEREAIRRVIVDGTGPTIEILSPPNESVRGGKVDLVFSVKDAQSGVDPSSIVVRLNSEPYPYKEGNDDWVLAGDNSTYTFKFDTSQIKGSIVQATIDVTATDKVGNESKGETLALYLDDQPPIVDLDPELIRESNLGVTQCSAAFDPVGDYAANDLARVLQLQKFRALVWDVTNQAPGQTIFYYSGPNLGSVVLRLQPNVEQGLLYDSDKDGFCDELATENTETGELLPFQALNGIPAQGNAYYGRAQDDVLGADVPMPNGCMYQMSTDKPPEPQRLCPPLNEDDMFRVIPWDIDATVPAIFGIGSLQGKACTGTDWEIGPVVKEGWICVAGRAEDDTHNVGISRPLRLCFDDGVDPPPTCLDHDADPPPSCTVDDCIPPPPFTSRTFKR